MQFKCQFMIFAAFCAVMFGFLLSGCSLMHPKPAFTAGEEISATAKVVAIDYPARRLALQGPEGNVAIISVGEEAYNFDQIAVGDMAEITYTRSVAVSLEKPKDKPSAISGTGMTRAPKGQKPEGVISNAMEITATVEDIDYANRLVDIRGPYGNLIEVQVDEDVENFKNIKKGDELFVRYTEAMAISVRPAATVESD